MSGPLSAKARREAQPIDALPFRVTRKYGEPQLIATVGDVRRRIISDIEEINERVNRIGSPEDKQAVAYLQQRADGIAAAIETTAGPVVIQAVVDSLTGVKYHVTIEDRRKAP